MKWNISYKRNKNIVILCLSDMWPCNLVIPKL